MSVSEARTATPSVRWVGQKHARGCGVAVLAMLTGHDYDSVRAYFEGINHETTGVFMRGLDDYLTDHGFAVARKSRHLGFFGGDKAAPPRSPWPPQPFADVQVCEVEVSEGSPCFHFIVLLKDGTVLDPLSEAPKKLSDYHRVNSMAGVYRVASMCSACGGTGIMEGDSTAPVGSIRRESVPCPECRPDA